MREKLIFIGGGGHCKSVLDVALDAGYEVVGILDKPERVGDNVLGIPIIGTDDDIPALAETALFVITVGQLPDCSLRRRISQKVESVGGRFATLIARDAHVSSFASVGEGSVVLHKAVINADAKVGRHSIINTMANIEHDAKVGDFCHVSTGAMVNGGTRLGDGCFVGSGAVLFQYIRVADGSVIPAGSVIKQSFG